MISIIAAVALNNVIGSTKTNKIPWYLPNDLCWFKKITLYKPIIMGRLTWESIRYKPLPNRLNIVISSKSKYVKDLNNEVVWVNSICEAIKIAKSTYKKELMVIGGRSIYNQLLYIADKMYLTHIHIYPCGNIYFPNYIKSEWTSTFKECHSYNIKNIYSYCFEVLTKNK